MSAVTAAAHRPITLLLDRLDELRERGPGQWSARCPAHDDRNPSLSIRETNDGTVLLKCWSGCTAAEIVAAVGLDLSDLFPRVERRERRYRDQHRLSARDALEIIRHDATVVACGGQSLLDGTATVSEIGRVSDAVTRIHRVIGGVYGRE
jgi:hypothetical protein